MKRHKKLHDLTWFALSITGGIIPLVLFSITALFGLLYYKIKKFDMKFEGIRGRLFVLMNDVDVGYGGMCLWGIIFVTKRRYSIKHELGHSGQFSLFGFLTPILISIPSFFRLKYRIYIKKKKPEIYLKPYHSIGYEKQAEDGGVKYFNEVI